MREYIQNISDIDTCNIHTLKSIAKSVNAEHLTDFISENYPEELLKLINLFSIKKQLLLNNLHILHVTSIGPEIGAIDDRNKNISPEEYNITILYKIKNNTYQIGELLKFNQIPYSDTNYSHEYMLYSIIDNLSDLCVFNNNENELKYTIKTNFKCIRNNKIQQITIEQLTLFDLLQTIDYFNNNKNKDNINFITLCKQTTCNINYKHEQWINPYHILILVLKSFMYNYYIKSYFKAGYIDEQTNTFINLNDLYISILETIQIYDKNYITDFITFHFYGLFYDMIINDSLKNDWKNGIFVAKMGEYTKDEFCDLVKAYITPEKRDACIEKIIYYKRTHVNFIQYLSILNNILNKDDEEAEFEYNILLYNFSNTNPDDINYNNKEYRRLLGLKKDPDNEGALIIDENKSDYILKIAKEFSDLCIQISYVRDTIKGLIQQYAYIGTNKIITDVVREYFIKNFSNRADWRLYGDRLSTYNDIVRHINELNGQGNISTLNEEVISENKSQFFSVDLVEYYDNTQYFNIYSELPSCILGYKVSGQIEQTTAFVLMEDLVSTSMIKGLISAEISGEIKWGVLSTIYDTFDFEIPEDVLLPKFKNTLDIVIDGKVVSSVPYWDITNAPTALLIPSGTIVSSTIPAGTVQISTYYIDNLVPIIGLCANFVTDYNGQFWIRDFSKEVPSSDLIKNEISFYENFFEDLKNAKTDELKFEVYRDKIYPLLSASWNAFATSGFLSNPILSGMELQYAGKYPGKKLTQNHANKTFTTIAPIPYVRNLTPDNGMYEETSLYLAKPFYENVAYYIALITKEILNMQDYNNKTGYGVPRDGWKQSYIEFKGYNSYYENSKNILDMSIVPSKVIDCDGPWVYSLLQQFIYLYVTHHNNIPYNTIVEYVDKYYTFVSNNIRQNISKQLYAFQHEIFRKQDYKVYNFQYDQYDSQFTLYKYKDNDKYEDTGEIWVRMKNYPLSVPLMNYTTILVNIVEYQDDIYDTLQCNQHITYANMLKELFNNAVQFGVLQNVIWVLGYSSYIDLHGELVKSSTTAYLKLGCIKFNKNSKLNTLVVDTTSIKFFSIYDDQDILTSIDQFVRTIF